MKTRLERTLIVLLAIFSAGIVSASAVDDIESLAAAADEALFATVPQAKKDDDVKKTETPQPAQEKTTPPAPQATVTTVKPTPQVQAPVAVEKPAVEVKTPVAVEKPAVEVKAPVAVEKPVTKVEQPAVQPAAAATHQVQASEKKTTVAVADAKKDKDGKAKGKDKGAKAKAKEKKPAKDMRITSENSAFDRKENIMLFDKNVFLDDDEYKMHADRVFVFMQGSNDVKRVVALGRVAITNELKSALCDKAVYDRPVQRVVMYGTPEKQALLKDSAKKGGTVTGTKITFWLDSEQMEVESSTVTLPAGTVNQKSMKNALGR